MAIHKLFIEEEETLDFQLFAIHTSLEDFRLAYFLNQKLQLRLAKNPEEIRTSQKKASSFFPRFTYEDLKNEVYYDLVANENESALQQDNATTGLFAENAFTTRNYLVPEYKKVHFFLRIDSCSEHIVSPAKILSELKTISWVSTAYSVDPNNLKSKNNLIF